MAAPKQVREKLRMGWLQTIAQRINPSGTVRPAGCRFYRRLAAFGFSAFLAATSPLLAKDAIGSNEEYERLFVLANVEFTLWHELAHVVIWELKPPVLGREEDAADNIAMIAELRTPEREGEAGMLEKLQAVADGWKLEWRLIQEDELENAYWDLHALEIQRYYNIACLVYGADPENRAIILKAAELPTDRAEGCQDEYTMANRAVDWLLTQGAQSLRGASALRRGVISVRREANRSLDGEKLDAWLKQSGIAERLAEAVSRRFHLPRDVEISFENCPFANASWDAETVSIKFCHSLINRYLYLARELQKDRLRQADASFWQPDGGSHPHGYKLSMRKDAAE